MSSAPATPSQNPGSGVIKPQWLGRYEVLDEIAQGGMATVYLGRARGAANFERLVAVKVCLPHLRGDEEFAGMFLDEARLAARIHHPNVVATLDVGDEEALYLVMEYIEGDKLSTLIKRASIKQQRIPLGVTARIMIDALSGLHAAHELKDALGDALQLVHRDVSPHNVLVGVDGIARISDFGIAKAEARATVTREGSLKGKMSYMAPEQLAGKPVDRRADIYAAGVVLWECLAGRRLFRADSEVETFNLVLQNKILRPSTLWPEVPPELDEIVLRALSLDPDLRFATAAEFAEALEELPIRISPARTVANTVEDLLTDVLTQRRDIVRSLDIGSDAVRTRRAAQRPHPAAHHSPRGHHRRARPAASAAAALERRARRPIRPVAARAADATVAPSRSRCSSCCSSRASPRACWPCAAPPGPTVATSSAAAAASHGARRRASSHGARRAAASASARGGRRGRRRTALAPRTTPCGARGCAHVAAPPGESPARSAARPSRAPPRPPRRRPPRRPGSSAPAPSDLGVSRAGSQRVSCAVIPCVCSPFPCSRRSRSPRSPRRRRTIRPSRSSASPAARGSTSSAASRPRSTSSARRWRSTARPTRGSTSRAACASSGASTRRSPSSSARCARRGTARPPIPATPPPATPRRPRCSPSRRAWGGSRSPSPTRPRAWSCG